MCAPWLCNGGSKVEGACMPVCVGVCIGGCMCVFARLAPGSQAITLYEVWQGESKTSASPKKSPGLGLVLGLDSDHIHTLTHIHLTALKKILDSDTLPEPLKYTSLDLKKQHTIYKQTSIHTEPHLAITIDMNTHKVL